MNSSFPTSLSPHEISLLRSIPLQDVMEKNGHHPVYKKDNEYIYRCPMPGHEDKDASFHVEIYSSSATQGDDVFYGRYNCISRGDIHGIGAISLQADLLGLSVHKDFVTIVKRLCSDHGIQINGIAPSLIEWSTVPAVNEFQWSECPWTDDHLRILGCKISPVFESDNDGHNYNTGDKMYSWSMIGDLNLEDQHPEPFDPNELGRIFGLYPISAFTTPAKNGVSRHAEATAGKMMFIFKSFDMFGNWRVKKYEPTFSRDDNGNSYKWTWWYQGGINKDRYFANSLYGDCDVIDALYNKDVVPTDSSTYHNHPTVSCVSKNEKGEEVDEPKFKRVIICSGPRDAIQVYYHSDAHVVYPHSENALIDKRALLRLLKIANEVFILFDADKTGCDKARKLNLEYLQMRNIELPTDLATLHAFRDGKPCKDISDFFARYQDVMRYQPANSRKTINERFEALITDSKPLKFWIGVFSKSLYAKTGGEQKFKYSFVTDNIKRFCEYNGFVTVRDGEILRFARIQDNIVTFIPDNQIVYSVARCMKEWLSDHPFHNDPALRTQIDMSHNAITIPVLQGIRTVTIERVPSSETLDFMFFRNGILRITPTEATLIPYAEADFYINAAKIKPYDYVPMPDTFSIVTDEQAVADLERQRDEEIALFLPTDTRLISATRKKWKERIDLAEYRIQWNVPIDQQPEIVQYVYDTCRKFWNIYQPSSSSSHIEDRHFLNHITGIGFLLSTYFTKSLSRIVYLLDGNTLNNNVADGRTGKSILTGVVETVRNVLRIPGKNFKTSVEESAKNFCEYDFRQHDIINVNDLSKAARAESFNNWAEGEVRIKRNYKDEFTVPAEFSPKMLISSNKMFDMSEGSTRDRYWRMYFHDYYHPEGPDFPERYSPDIKFGHEIPNRESEVEFQGCIHFLVQCLQFFMQVRRYIAPPSSSEETAKELQADNSIENGFIEWADRIFEHPAIIGTPIPKRDLVISFLQTTGKQPNSSNIKHYMQTRKFSDMLSVYCDKHGIFINPDIVFRNNSDRKGTTPCPKSSAWVYELDSSGNAVNARVYKDKMRCYYFYPITSVPEKNNAIVWDQQTDQDLFKYGYIPD